MRDFVMTAPMIYVAVARPAARNAQPAQFAELIEAGDEEGLVKLTLEHWALSRDHLAMVMRPDPLPVDLALSA